jgi:hypothetical protein
MLFPNETPRPLRYLTSGKSDRALVHNRYHVPSFTVKRFHLNKETRLHKIYFINQALRKLLTNFLMKGTHKFILVTERSFIIMTFELNTWKIVTKFLTQIFMQTHIIVAFSPDVSCKKSSPCVFKKGDMVIRSTLFRSEPIFRMYCTVV